MSGRGHLRFLLLLAVAATATSACRSETPTSGSAADTSTPVAARPYPASQPFHYARVETQRPGDGTATFGLTPTGGPSAATTARIVLANHRLQRLELDTLDGTKITIEPDSSGRPAIITTSRGATVLLDWSRWSTGVLLARAGTTRPEAESRTATPLPITAAQRAEIDRALQGRTTATFDGPRSGQHPISFANSDAVTVPMRANISRWITVRDAQGKNVSATSRLESITCTSPTAVCSYETLTWLPSSTDARLHVSISLDTQILVPHDSAWEGYRKACEDMVSSRDRWGQGLTAVTAILAVPIVAIAATNPALSIPAAGIAALIALPAAMVETTKAINGFTDCTRIADQHYGETIATRRPAPVTIKALTICIEPKRCFTEDALVVKWGDINSRDVILSPSGESTASPQATTPAGPKQATPTASATAQQTTTSTPAPPKATATPSAAAAAPVRLTGVTAPSQVKGGTAGATTITWTGTLKHPARISWAPFVGAGGCSNAAGAVECGFASWTIDPGTTGTSFRIDGAPGCPKVTARWIVAWDVTIVDGNGRSNSIRLTSACVP